MSDSEIAKLEQTILALEAQRAVLGDSVVDTAIGPLRERLQALRNTPETPSAETQQRKIITVLFADIPGLAALAEILDAEDLRDAANALWEQLDAVILQHGGRIDKHMGYGVMALWGAEVVREDDPEQAILAALGLRSTLHAFISKSPLFSTYSALDELEIRVGINAGPAIVGLVGTTGEFTAIGDTVNLGARLNQAAKPGEILISSDAYHLVRGVFEVAMQPPLQVKGKSEPVQAYLVRAEKPRAFHIQVRGVEGIETQLFGREAELAAIKDAYRRLFAERQPRLVTVAGDMGLGKSRLLQEFMAWADPLPEDWYLFQGRSTPSQTGTPYSLLRDIFSFRFEILDNDSLATVFDKMEHGFAEMMPGDEHSREYAHIVGQLLGFDFASSPYLRGLLQDSRQLRSLGFVILTRFVVSAAHQYPIILMLDDIHWADTGSLNALRYLAENVPPETPLLILAMARPSLFERLPDWGTGLPSVVKLELKPLTRADSRALVGQILQKASAIPETLQEMIIDGADGNPFYLEELIKMLVDGKVIHAEGETWEIDLDRLDTVSVPSTLAGVLQARLDRLDSFERASLQRASVVGRVFCDRAVESLGFDSRVEHRQLEESLSVLRSKELIFASPVSTFTGTQEYSFKHALLRDVAYETVLKRQRARFHERAADWLSKASGERRGEYLPIIAEHYEKAGDDEKALAVLIEAGERALGVSAFSESLRLFQRALSLIAQDDIRQQAYIYLKIGESCFRSGEYTDSLKNTEKALDLAREVSVGNLLASVLYQLGQLHAEMGNYQLAEQHLTQALALARTSGTKADATLARILFGLGNIYWRMGDLSKAHSFCSESRDLAARLDDTHTLMLALNRLGVVSGLMGDSAEEEQLYLQVLSLARLVGNRERAAVALNNLGALADEQHDPAKAQGFYLQAMSLAREMGAQQSLALYLNNLGHCEIALGNLDAAYEHLREGLALAEHYGAAPWAVIAVLFFALLSHTRGDDERAFMLFGLARRQAAFSTDHQRLMDQALADWGINQAEAAKRMDAGTDLEWKQVVQELLS